MVPASASDDYLFALRLEIAEMLGSSPERVQMLWHGNPLDVDVLPVDDVGLLEEGSVGLFDTDEPDDGVVLVVLVTGEG